MNIEKIGAKTKKYIMNTSGHVRRIKYNLGEEMFVSSLIGDVITPLLLTPALKAAHVDVLSKLTWGAVKYGNFLSSVIKFIVIALVLFMIIQVMNRMKRKKDADAGAPAIPELTLSEKLLKEISQKLDK